MKNEVLARLKEIEDRDGCVKSSVVLEDARDPSSPLHSEFEWNDAIAGEMHRLAQARDLIRSFKIRLVVPDGAGKSTNYQIGMFQSPGALRESGGGYMSMRSILSDSEVYADLVRTAAGEALALRRRLTIIAQSDEPEIRDLIAAIDRFIEARSNLERKVSV